MEGYGFFRGTADLEGWDKPRGFVPSASVELRHHCFRELVRRRQVASI